VAGIIHRGPDAGAATDSTNPFKVAGLATFLTVEPHASRWGQPSAQSPD